MTLELLNKIYEENDIPKDALLMSDSGWECGATDMDGSKTLKDTRNGLRNLKI